MRLEDVKASIEARGLDFERLREQQELIAGALARGRGPQFKIIDTCRLDNGGLVPLARYAQKTGERPGKGIAAFVPAAGAASRYSAPLAPLQSALEQGDLGTLRASLGALTASGAEAWPLPPGIKTLLREQATLAAPSQATRDALLQELAQPKALMPCVREGLSFLQLKDLEHACLDGLEGQVFVTPPGMTADFAAAMQRTNDGGRQPSRLPTAYLEQGPQLSTIRFRRDGSPFVEADGGVSVVPAGHGALATLFGDVRRTIPAADALFIRNIDNVNGTGPAVRAATAAFLTAQRTVLEAFRGVRAALAQNDLRKAAEFADTLSPTRAAAAHGKTLPAGLAAAQASLSDVRDPAERRLWEVLLEVAHTVPPARPDRDLLARLYARPVNLLGQVPNTGKDVGGTPCFVATPQGTVKVSIEVPHASDADRRDFLANPARATHFNPVFACVEIPKDAGYYARSNQDFWLLSEKTYRGEAVVYYETVLYELLGNSFLANTIFVEVPRDVFHPHKVLADAAGRSVKDWTP
jgi:hypothetical protein